MNFIEKIKMFLVVGKELDRIKEAKKMGAGIRTTEFWLTALTSLLSIYGMVAGMLDPKTTAMVVGGIVMVYTIARAIVKFTPTTKDDGVLAKIEAILKDKGIVKDPQ